MTETASLVIKVDSSGAARATSDLNKLDRAAGGSERAASKLGKAWGVAIGLISSAAIVGATTAFLRQADAYANMAAKVRLVTGSQQEQLKAQKALFDLSQRTSSDLQATTDLYVKLGQSSEYLAKNQTLLLSVTEKVSKALVISGADAASSAAVIRQFSQAMASGALRGDEFVSVMEGAPRLARAIADGLKVPIGALREMAAEGELTAAKVIKALEDQGATIDREFGSMPLTVGRATQQVKNSLLQMIGTADQAEGASTDLAEAIQGLAGALSDPQFQAGFRDTIGFLADVAAGAINAAGALREYFAANSDKGDASLTNRRNELETKLFGEERAAGSVLGAAPAAYRNALGIGADSIRAEIAEIDALQKARSKAAMFGGVTATSSSTASAADGMPDTATGKKDKKSGLSDAEKAAQRLQSAYQSLNESQREQIALFGETGEAAKVRYAIEQGALVGLTEVKKAQLIADAEQIDALEELAAIEQVWAEAATDNIVKLGDRTLAIEEGIAATDELIEAMEFERSLIGLNNIEREKAIALRYADVNATAEQIAKIGELAVATEKAREQQQFADETQRSLTNAVTDYATGAKSASEAFGDFADQLYERAVQFLADKAIQALFDSFDGSKSGGAGDGSGGWAGLATSIMGMFGGGSANGNAFLGGNRVTAFANGGITSGPELFPMSGNRFGLRGEAGDEAVMPLKRGRDGKLGVAGGGGGVTNLTQHFNVQGSPDRSTREQMSRSAGREAARGMARTGR